MSNLTFLLEEVLRSQDAEEHCSNIGLRNREDRYADVRVFVPDRRWLDSRHGERLVEAFRDHAAIASAERRRDTISLRLTDDFIAELGRHLVVDDTSVMPTSDVLAGKKYMVGFIGPNTCKALHVGHLRNIVLGHGIAASLETAGSEVLRESLVGDIGRQVCEALAGFLRFYSDMDPRKCEMKPDVFVGRCYSEYLRHEAVLRPESEGLTDPNIEESLLSGDFADELMETWRKGSPEIRRQWQKLRSWVLVGHQETLGQLGVFIDRCDYEADAFESALEMIEEGLEKELLVQYEGGMVGYATGRPEYGLLTVRRQDGFPTEHGRLLAVYDRLLDELYPEWTYVELAGDEWQPSAMVLGELLSRLRPGPRNERHIRLFHGMATLDEVKISSSAGEPLLIEEFYRRVRGAQAFKDLMADADKVVKEHDVADILVRSYFFSAPSTKPMPFSWANFMAEQGNPGWDIAHAWCQCHDQPSRGESRADEAVDISPSYRYVILRSQAFRYALQRSVDQFDVSALFRFLRGFCKVYSRSDPSEKLDRAARSILRKAFKSLGYVAGQDV